MSITMEKISKDEAGPGSEPAAGSEPEAGGEPTASGEPAAGNPGGGNLGKQMLKYTIPAIVSNTVNATYNLVDQVIIGNAVGMLGIAATNVAFPLTPVSAAIGYLLGTGGASNFSLKLGEGDREQANKYAGNTLSLSIIVGTIIAAAVLLFLKPLVHAFGSTDTVWPYAVTYTRIIAIGIPFGIFTTGASAFIRADGSPRYSMWCTLTGAIINLVGDPIAVFVFGWGIAGVAWATTISQMATAAIAVYYFVKKAKIVSIKSKNLIPKMDLTKRTCALGSTPAINQIGISILQIIMNNTLRYYGGLSVYGSDIPLGCVGAISKLNVIFTSLNIGIGQGCQPIIGFDYGAQNYARVKRALKIMLIAAGAISISAFAVFQIFPRGLMRIFGEDDPLYLEFAVHYLRVFMFMIFLSGVQPIAATFFPSIGKGARGLWISLSRQVLFIMPLIIILPLFYGLEGAVIAGPISDFCAASVSTLLIVIEVRKMSALQALRQ